MELRTLEILIYGIKNGSRERSSYEAFLDLSGMKILLVRSQLVIYKYNRIEKSANSWRHFHRFVILFFLSLPDENLIYELLIN